MVMTVTMDCDWYLITSLSFNRAEETQAVRQAKLQKCKMRSMKVTKRDIGKSASKHVGFKDYKN